MPKPKRLLMERPEELDPLQSGSMDYTIRFAKMEQESAEEIVEELMKDAQIDRGLAVQIAKAMPATYREIRTFLGRRRIIAEEAMNKILGIIEKYRQ